jgi:dihydroflavonol-4-reductase
LDGLDVEFVRADVTDSDSITRALAGCDVVYHLAAIISVAGDRTGLVKRVNVDGVGHAARAARANRVSRFVHCSSVHAFDLESTRLVTEDTPSASSPHLPSYDRSKAAGESALDREIEAGLDAVIVNPTAMIGPQDHAPSRMGGVLLALARHRLPALIAGGFDWVDVRDVASSLLAAEDKGRTSERYLVSGHHLTLKDLARRAAGCIDTRPPPVVLPLWFARIWSPLADIVARRTGNPLWYTTESLHALRFGPKVSSAKATQELGHRARPIEETLSDTFEWFAVHGMLDSS